MTTAVHQPERYDAVARTEREIKSIDHLDLWVGNPRQAAHFYRSTFGLALTHMAGLETGRTDSCAYVLSHGDIRIVLTGPLVPDSSVARFLNAHGDGVKDVAFRVADVAAAFHTALENGATAVQMPLTQDCDTGTVTTASVAAPGDVVHSFVSRTTSAWELPGFRRVQPDPLVHSCVSSIDHVAMAVAPGTLAEQIAFYTSVFGFRESHEEYVATGLTAMNSKVVESPDGHVKIPLVEPVAGPRRSQVDEYIRFHGGPGVQHVAFLSEDIVTTVSLLRANGIDFLRTPDAYYDLLTERVGAIDKSVGTLREHQILVDKDPWGHLMQVFTKPIQARPTFFLEVIQRNGARGFGSGNIRALFEAVEREQRSRNTL